MQVVVEHGAVAGAGSGVVAHGGTCLHAGRGGRVERFGGGLGDQRLEHVERKSRTAGDALCDGVHVIDEIAGENRREMRFRPAGRVGPDHRARETAGEGFQLRAQGFVVGFEEDGNLRKIHFAALGEGLEGIEDGPAHGLAGQGFERYASGGVGHDGPRGNGQRSGRFRYGPVAYGDQVDVGFGQPGRVRGPLGAGECGDRLSALGVAGEEL